MPCRWPASTSPTWADSPSARTTARPRACSAPTRWSTTSGFSKPPPGNGRLSGRGNWELEGDTRRSDSIELRFAAGGSFRDDSESTLLQVAKGGDHPSLYFDTNSDKGYGYEVRRTG
ncbi:hypothetical protein [Streptomyces echinatus]|uniref:hypothetical protein n=1 Tax=Streptomyces echinatus TaxID=67293 RepID=UPI0037B1BFD3